MQGYSKGQRQRQWRVYSPIGGWSGGLAELPWTNSLFASGAIDQILR
ncbi:hypothetical protein [Okeania sp. SIO2G5]|nr:hypothetical protein [Okeania sp. SIO2G5]